MEKGPEANRKAIEAHSKLEEVLSDIARRRKHTFKAEEITTLEALRHRCLACVRTLLQDFFGVPQSPGTEAIDATLTEIEEILGALEPEVHNLVGAAEDQNHFRQAIELHAKLEKAAKTLKRVRDIPSLSNEQKDKAEVVRIRFAALMKVLLEDIFKVEPDKVASVAPDPLMLDSVVASGDPTPESEPQSEPQSEPEPPAHPSVGDGLVAIARSIDHLAEAIRFNALPAHQRRRLF